MHIDFPLYAKYNDILYLARGKENSDSYLWEGSDPVGLNEYFLNRFKDNDQLRRIVRYIKKWKQYKYANSINPHEIPPSIALTIWSCLNFIPATDGGTDYDLKALYETLNSIIRQFRILQYNIDGSAKVVSVSCSLSVLPYSGRSI